MYFNEYFNVKNNTLEEYGALNISLDFDLPAFIDPMLIFSSDADLYKEWHNKIVKYILLLSKLKGNGDKNVGLIQTYFTFKEIRNNWLGLSIKGNKGSAIGWQYGEALFENIENIIDTHNVSSSIHFEKLCLFEEGIGKDKISDFTTNILLADFAKYTEKFARDNISSNLCKEFRIDKAYYDFDKDLFVPQTFYLPFIINEKGKEEYVLLTPKDILRVNENEINKENFYINFDNMLATIDNQVLRFEISSYVDSEIKKLYDYKDKIGKKVTQKECRECREHAIDQIVLQHPEIYDYFIKLKENSAESIISIAINEINGIENFFINNAKLISNRYLNFSLQENESAFDESLRRILFLKREIEENGLWRNLYKDGEPIASENDLQRLFRLVWCSSNYNFDSEVNNGNGPVDFKVSYGRNNVNLIEFKLAKNPKLKNVFAQVDAYEAANSTKESIVVIFFFSENEKNRVDEIIKGYHGKKEIVLIDCRNDNKVSASNRV